MPDLSDALRTAEIDRRWDPLTPWEDPAWRLRALTWVQDRLTEHGRRAAPDGWRVRVRPWSVIFRIPPADGDDVLWFKANPPASAYEPALLRFLAGHRPERVVAPLAVDAELGWSLQPHGGSVFREYLDHDPAASIRDWEEAVGQYGELQRSLVPHTEAIAALGIPRCPTANLPTLVEELIDGATSLAEDEAAQLKSRLPQYAAWCAELAALGIPDALDHADLHDNQILGPDPTGGYRFFDWGDAIVGHPFASLRITLDVVRERFGASPDLARLRDAYLEPWTGFGTSADLRRAVTLACRVGIVGRALAWGRVFEEHRARLGNTVVEHLAEMLRSVGADVVRIGALAPLTRPGWAEAGRQLVAGLELAVRDVNDAGGIGGKALELIVRDTAADPRKGEAAVDELAGLGVAALAGEYHSVVARAVAARADALGVPFLCSSAVLDALIDEPTAWVARLPPAQSRGWRIYADFLLKAGHSRIAVAAQPSVYWESGTRILREHLATHDGTVVELDLSALSPTEVCDALADDGATALLLLAGYPEPAVAIVKAVRADQRLAEVLIGAPAGQPELAEWAKQLGDDAAAVPFLRYLPERFGPLGARVEAALREQLAEAPSFVAFEGYDTIAVLAEALRTHGTDRACLAGSWPDIAVEGSRGRIQFSRAPGSNVWQWVWPPIQVVDRDPEDPTRFRVLHVG
jgi:ABC-type branched-subunit amino acid transport system substrate-binding protein